MKRCSWMLIVAGALAIAAAPAVAEILLSADFTGMTAGQPVGIGGPTVGEPVSNFNCVSTIRDAPFPTTCLEMDDETAFGTGEVKFSFLGDAEVTAGQVEISVKLWFAVYEEYFFYVREQNFAAHSFNTIYFQGSGDVYVSDAAGAVGVVGHYDTGRAIELRIVHDLDAGTYDIWFDGLRVVDDRAHGIVGSGIGGVYVGINHDANLDGIFYMDDLLVATGPFAANEDRAWGGVKAAWR
jgi:hypothetical protein